MGCGRVCGMRRWTLGGSARRVSLRKRRRISHERYTRLGMGKRHLSLFDTLNLDPIELVLRYMSDSPLNGNWAACIDPRDVALVHELSGTLGDAGKHHFKGLCLGTFDKDLEPFVLYNEVDDGSSECKDMVFVLDCQVALRVARMAGDVYSTLVVGDPYGKTLLSSGRLDELAVCCSAVRKLVACTVAAEELIERFGPSLTTLSIGLHSNAATMETLASRCTQLKELNISQPEESNFVIPQDFWARVGPPLEKLTVEFVKPCGFEVQRISQHCRNLRHLVIDPCEEVGDTLADCLISYGEQLEFAYLTDLGANDASEVVSACPNAKFGVSLGDNVGANVLIRVAGQLDALIVADWLEFHPDMEEGWQECQNLRRLGLMYPISSEELRKIFIHPKGCLKFLRFTLDARHHSFSPKSVVSCIRRVGRSTGQLRTLWLTIPFVPEDAFDELVAKNPHLESVHVDSASFRHLRKCPDAVRKAVNVLLCAPHIVDLRVPDEELTRAIYDRGVDKMCTALRTSGRRVCVNVLGVDYLK